MIAKKQICKKCNAEKPVNLFGKVKMSYKGEAKLVPDDTCNQCLKEKLGDPIPEFRNIDPSHVVNRRSRIVKKWMAKKLIENPDYQKNLTKRNCKVKKEKYNTDPKYRRHVLEYNKKWLRNKKAKTEK